MEKIYKWENPSEWLEDFLQSGAASPWSVINTLLTMISEDDIQDLFQSEMEADGYFEVEEEDQNDSE